MGGKGSTVWFTITEHGDPGGKFWARATIVHLATVNQGHFLHEISIHITQPGNRTCGFTGMELDMGFSRPDERLSVSLTSRT